MAELVGTLGGLAIASVGTVGGLAVADAGTIGGLDNTGGGGGPNAFSDDFNRANGALGANWVNVTIGTADLNTNAYRMQTGSFAPVTSIYQTTTNSLVQYVMFQLGSVTAYPWMVFRYTNSGSPFYAIQLDGVNGTMEWYHYANATAGSGTMIGSQVDSGGDMTGITCGMTITGTGAGTEIRIWRSVTGLPSAAGNWNGDTTPDASWIGTNPGGNAVDSGGFVGIGGQQSVANSVFLENFFGGGL